MAYYVDFMSFGGTAYRVEIGGTNGIPLTGAPEPFVTHEDDGGDLFTPVRLQTGTIRVIADGSLMADIIPENNTTTTVALKMKNSNSTVWEGYLCAAGYSQPWDGNLNMIEIPVQSVLSSLYDASIDTQYVGQLISFSDIINAGLASMGFPLHDASTADDCNGAWMSAKVNASVFFSKEEISNQGDRQTSYFGKSYGEIIEDICKLFGLMCRDTGTGLLFATYDKPTGFAVGVITSVFTFKGANNEQGFMQGKKTAKVVVSLGDTKNTMTELPFAPETSNTPVIIDLFEGKLYVQEYSQRTGGIEAWSEFKYSVSVDSDGPGPGAQRWWKYCYIGIASFSDFSQNCLINAPSQHLQDNSVLYTGAFPVRWFYQQYAETVRLKNGLFIQQQTAGPLMNDVVDYNIIYSVETGQPFSLNDGYIVLNMSCNTLEENVARTKWMYGSSTMLFVTLQFGNKYWNGTEWSDTLSRFGLTFGNGGRIATNKTAEMNVDADSGYFIPVLSKLEGYVSLHIYDVCCNMTYVGTDLNQLDERGKIISDLEMSFFYLNNLTASDRNTNVYRQTILNSGFGEDKTIELPIGTMNNNLPTQALIKSDATTYIESLSYNGVSQRPEMHLLDRMVSYYDRVRQTLRAKVGTGLGLFDTLYSHGGRVFVGIDAQHNWRDDTQEVEFIEVRTE